MNRREFLGQVACALAAAGIPCRIPEAAIVADTKWPSTPIMPLARPLYLSDIVNIDDLIRIGWDAGLYFDNPNASVLGNVYVVRDITVPPVFFPQAEDGSP